MTVEVLNKFIEKKQTNKQTNAWILYNPIFCCLCYYFLWCRFSIPFLSIVDWIYGVFYFNSMLLHHLQMILHNFRGLPVILYDFNGWFQIKAANELKIDETDFVDGDEIKS